MKNKEKFGMKTPNTIAEALQFDREAGNTKWTDATALEMKQLDDYQTFYWYGTV